VATPLIFLTIWNLDLPFA